MTNLGTDFDSNYTFKDGDLLLVSDEMNLVQSIRNRLTTKLGQLNQFYNEYGSYLRTYQGAKKNKVTLRFITVEINTVLRQDPRLQDTKVNVELGEDGRIIIDLSDIFDEDTNIPSSLVITDEYGVDIIGD